MRFNTKIAGGALIALGALNLAIGLAMGHSASSQPPADLSAKGAALNVWKTVALLADKPGKVALLDVRSSDQVELYSVSGSQTVSKSASALIEKAVGKSHAVIIAEKDAVASKLVAKVRRKKPGTKFHYLRGGARSWYLALDLPVALFSSKKPPFGYQAALTTVKAFIKSKKGNAKAVKAALDKLVNANYQPNLLAGKKKPKAGGKKKKISGGCG
jgi:hypothetical protein